MQNEAEHPYFPNQKFFTLLTTVRYLKSVVCHILVDSASRVKKLQIRHASASRFRGEVRWVWTFHFKKSCHMPSLAELSTIAIFEGKKPQFVVFLVFCIIESGTDISFQQVLGARLCDYEILLLFLHTTSHYHFLVAALATSQYRAWEAAGAVSWILRKNWNPLKTAKRLQICCERSSSKPSSPRKMIRKRSLTNLHQEAELEKFLEFSGWSSFLCGLNKRQICWQEVTWTCWLAKNSPWQKQNEIPVHEKKKKKLS